MREINWTGLTYLWIRKGQNFKLMSYCLWRSTGYLFIYLFISRIWSFTKFFSYLLHMGVQATNKNIFFYLLQRNWNGNLTQIVLLTSLLRLFLINAVVISKPVVVIIFLLAFFIIFLLQMVHNSGFLASFLISNYRNITPSSLKNKISIGFLFANG